MANYVEAWHVLDSINQVDPDVEELWRGEKTLELKKAGKTEVTVN